MGLMGLLPPDHGQHPWAAARRPTPFGLHPAVQIHGDGLAPIDAPWASGWLAVGAISFWEVTMLAARSRINLHQSPGSWRLDWLRAGIAEIPLDGALARGATLVTADRAIQDWPGPLLRHAAPS